MDQKGQLKKNDKLLAVEQEGGSQKEGDGADYEKDELAALNTLRFQKGKPLLLRFSRFPNPKGNENHQQNWNCHLQILQ